MDESPTRHANQKAWPWTGVDGIEPTSNAGERDLPHAVIWRKISFGAQGAAGSRFVETLLTTIESRRQQGRNVFAFGGAAAVQANFVREAAPSLLSGA